MLDQGVSAACDLMYGRRAGGQEVHALLPGGKGNSSGSVQSSPASLEALSHTCAPMQPQG